MAEMTVRETMEFSRCCQGVGFKYGKLPHLHVSCFSNLYFDMNFSRTNSTDMISELLRREEKSGIKPDEDLDILIKVCATI